MYVLRPVSHETVWGGAKAKKLSIDQVDRLGHLYLVNGHVGLSNWILNGEFKDHTLAEIFPIMRDSWNLSEFEEFPLTIALTDAKENLSIQVHPDNMAAWELENRQIGKKESWFFLTPPDNGWIYSGCSYDSKEEIKKKVEDNQIETVVGHMPIRKYDYVCVSSGTLHALTAGSFVYEVEFGSDFTYRFYDYERVDIDGQPRELHVDKAIYSIKPEIVPKVIHEAGNERILEDVYEIDFIKESRNYYNSSKEIECVALLDADGICEGVRVKNGMSILLWPGEYLSNVMIHYAITAKLVRHREERE